MKIRASFRVGFPTVVWLVGLAALLYSFATTL